MLKVAAALWKSGFKTLRALRCRWNTQGDCIVWSIRVGVWMNGETWKRENKILRELQKIKERTGERE